MNNQLRVQINDANLRNSHFYLSSWMSFFPSDTVGGASAAERAQRELTITLPFGREVATDIAGDKKIFRKRAWIRELFEYRKAVAGDNVVLTWTGPYQLHIDVEGKKVANDNSKVGRTIQVVIDNPSWLERKKFEIPSTYLSFFPADALGARGEADREAYPERGKAIELDYDTVKSVCDVATRKSGAMRPRDNSGMRQFLEANRAALGDVVCITRTAERSYKISLIKR